MKSLGIASVTLALAQGPALSRHGERAPGFPFDELATCVRVTAC